MLCSQLHRHGVATILAEEQTRQLRKAQSHVLLLSVPLEDGPRTPRCLLGEAYLAWWLAESLWQAPAARVTGLSRAGLDSASAIMWSMVRHLALKSGRALIGRDGPLIAFELGEGSSGWSCALASLAE